MTQLRNTRAPSNAHKIKIIHLIREQSPIHRAEIARICGLSIPTVMKIVDEFISLGLVEEIGFAKSTGGKPPVLLRFVSAAKYIVGVDIGSTKIKAILMDMDANIVTTSQQFTAASKDYDAVLAQIIALIQDIVNRSGVPHSKILGVGIGAPGLINSQTGEIIYSPDFGWKNRDMHIPLERILDLPVFIENVTRSMAMGEIYFGLGKNIDNFMCINLGYGIGSAVVIDGKIYTGSYGTSGEFGHIVVEKDGPLCDCGNYGCLEAMASANAMAKQAQLAIKNGALSLMPVLVNENIEKIDAKIIFEAYEMGDALASSIVGQATSYLGIAIGGIINFLDPKIIILEGGVSRAGETLLVPLRKKVKRHILSGRDPHFRSSPLSEDAAAIGAASYLLDKFIQHGCIA